MEVSVVIRFRNEEEYIEAVLDAVCQQEFSGYAYEIIGVNNNSSDDSSEIFSKYSSRILKTDDYRPGKALNQAIVSSNAKYICVLSAHTIPANAQWLRTLHSHMTVESLAGVYGAQLYPLNSQFLDKRDLDIFSTLTPRVEHYDSDFWNANSMFPKAVWEQQSFDETVFELEDHHWTKRLLPKGYFVHFEPEALVYHYSHLKRLDRIFLPPSDLPDEERMENALEKLMKAEPTDWPTIMDSGLTLSSLCHLDSIKKAVACLGQHLLSNPDFDVRWRMAQALGKINTSASAIYLTKALSDSSFYVRDEASWSLARLKGLAIDPVLSRIPFLKPHERPFAALALGKSGSLHTEIEAVKLLLNDLDSSHTEQCINAVYFAGEIAGIATSEKLFIHIKKLVNSSNSKLQMVCCWALGRFFEATSLGDTSLLTSLQSLVIQTNVDQLVRFEALIACGRWALARRSEELMQWIATMLKDDVDRICFGAAQCLRIGIEQGLGTDVTLPEMKTSRDFGTAYELNLIKQIRTKRFYNEHIGHTQRNDSR